jgi:hypothetical protein
LEAKVRSLQATVSEMQGQISSQQSQLAAIQSDPALALGPFVRVDPNSENEVVGPNITFKGANIHIVSGSGFTDDNDNPTGLERGKRFTQPVTWAAFRAYLLNQQMIGVGFTEESAFGAL